MATYNAYVTTAGGGLTADSRVYVLTWGGVRESPVPELAEVGGVMFWPRVAAALRAIGWRPERVSVLDDTEPGRVWFNAEELP
jgi:hypothetical protein